MKWTRIPIWIGKCLIKCRVDAIFPHAEILERHRRTEAAGKLVESPRRFRGAKRSIHTRHRVGRSGAIVCHYMWQDRRVKLRMGKIKHPAERVAELVMQRHSD